MISLMKDNSLGGDESETAIEGVMVLLCRVARFDGSASLVSTCMGIVIVKGNVFTYEEGYVGR